MKSKSETPYVIKKKQKKNTQNKTDNNLIIKEEMSDLGIYSDWIYLFTNYKWQKTT